MSAEPIHVLHVDDEPDFADLAATYLERENDQIVVETATDPSEALEILDDGSIDCIVSDYDMPEENGIEFLSSVREEFPDLPFILFTGKGSEEVASAAISEGVSDYLQKKPGTERYELLANRIVTHVERNRAERALNERERELQLFRKAVEAAGHSIYWTDRDSTIQYVNPAFEESTGYTPAEALGQNPNILKSGEHDEAFYDRLWETIRSGETWRNEVVNTTKSGERYVVDQTISPVTDESGEITHFVAVNADITDQKRREEQLREERDRREALFRNPSDAIVEIEFEDETPVIQAANQTFQETFGYDPETVIGEPVSEVLVPDEDDTKDRHDDIKRRVLDGEAIDTRVRRQTREGPREFRLRVFPIDIVDGHRGSYAVYTDITDRVEREEYLEEYRTLVENVGDPMYLLDSDGRIEMANRAMANYLETDVETMVGERLDAYLTTGEFSRGTALIRDLLDDPDRRWDTIEATVVTATGKRRRTEFNVAVLTDEDGALQGTAGVARDITERKKREERLEQFTSLVSHDLRNPLTVAGGSLELAREDCESEELERAAGAFDRMDALVEDLLTWARVGEEIQEVEPVEVTTLFEHCWETVPTANARLKIASELTIRADRSRLQQLIENLLRNAVEHGGEGVTISVGVLADRDGFYVADDGPGVPDDVRDEIFDSGYSRREEGTGLGLAIVGEIVGAHGWDVSVTESDAGGARFEISGVEILE